MPSCRRYQAADAARVDEDIDPYEILPYNDKKIPCADAQGKNAK